MAYGKLVSVELYSADPELVQVNINFVDSFYSKPAASLHGVPRSLTVNFYVKVRAADGFRNKADIEAHLKSTLFLADGTVDEDWVQSNFMGPRKRLAARFGARYGIHAMALLSNTEVLDTVGVKTLSDIGFDYAYPVSASWGGNTEPTSADDWTLSYNPLLRVTRDANATLSLDLPPLKEILDPGGPVPATSFPMEACAAFYDTFHFLGSLTEPFWLRLLCTINLVSPRFSSSSSAQAREFRKAHLTEALGASTSSLDPSWSRNLGKMSEESAYFETYPRAIFSSELHKYHALQEYSSIPGGSIAINKDRKAYGSAKCLPSYIVGGPISNPDIDDKLVTVVAGAQELLTEWYFGAAVCPMNEASSYLMGVLNGATTSNSSIITAMQSVGKRASPMAHRSAKLAMFYNNIRAQGGVVDHTAVRLNGLADSRGLLLLADGSAVISNSTLPGSRMVVDFISDILTQGYSWDDAYLL